MIPYLLAGALGNKLSGWNGSLPGVKVSTERGTGVPFVDSNFNNWEPAPSDARVMGASTTAGATNGGVPSTWRPTAQSGNLTNGGGGGYDKDAAERAATLFGIDNGIQSATDGLGRLDSRLQTGYANIDRDYQREYDKLSGNRTSNLDRYKQQEDSQLNQYESNRNQVASSARNWLDSARRQLGAQGAGGGSASRFGVAYDAQQQAAAGNSQAQSTNNANMSAIAGSRNRDEDEFKNALSDLDLQRTNGRDTYADTIDQQRAEFMSTLGQLQGQRQIAEGGDFRAAQAAASPYTSKIAAILDGIDARSATPAVQARQVTTGKPDLSGYDWSRPTAAPTPQQDPTLSNPNLMALFGLEEEQKQLV